MENVVCTNGRKIVGIVFENNDIYNGSKDKCILEIMRRDHVSITIAAMRLQEYKVVQGIPFDVAIGREDNY